MAPAFSKPFPPEFLPSHDLDQLPDPPPSCPAVMAETLLFEHSGRRGDTRRRRWWRGWRDRATRHVCCSPCLSRSQASASREDDLCGSDDRACGGSGESHLFARVGAGLRGKPMLRIVRNADIVLSRMRTSCCPGCGHCVVRDADIVLSGMRTPCVAYPAVICAAGERRAGQRPPRRHDRGVCLSACSEDVHGRRARRREWRSVATRSRRGRARDASGEQAGGAVAAGRARGPRWQVGGAVAAGARGAVAVGARGARRQSTARSPRGRAHHACGRSAGRGAHRRTGGESIRFRNRPSSSSILPG